MAQFFSCLSIFSKKVFFVIFEDQDFAQGGPETKGGAQFLNAILDVCSSNRGPNMKWEAQILNGRAGRAPVATGDGPASLSTSERLLSRHIL